MVIADLNILIVGCEDASIPVIFMNNLIFDLYKLPSREDQQVYSNWMIFEKIHGTLLQIYCKKRVENDYDDEAFDLISMERSQKVVVYEKYFEEIEKVLKYAIELSPIKQLVVLIRLEGDTRERFKPTQKLTKFLKDLQGNKVLFNYAYILKN